MRIIFSRPLLVFLSVLSLTTSSAQVYSPTTILDVKGISGAASVGDFDNDGDEDLLVSGNSMNVSRLQLFVSEAGTLLEKRDTGLPDEATSAEWIDYDGDGDLDVFWVYSTTKGASGDFFINENGIFAPLGLVVPKTLQRPTFSVVDYDGDGDVDVFAAGAEGTSFSRRTYLLKNTEQGFATTTSTLQGDSDGQFAWADFDNDNDLDVLISGSYSSSTLYINNGEDSFTAFKSDFPAAVRGTIRWADFDNDHDPDILISGFGYSGAQAKIFTNNGDKTFSEYTGVTLTGTEQGDSQWIDYDKDGDLDIFHSGWASGTFIRELYELDNGTYTLLSPLGLGDVDFFSSHVAFLDYDEDDDYDVLILNDAYKTRLYRNDLKTNPYPLDNRPSWPVDLTAHPLSASDIQLDWRDFGSTESHFSVEMREGPSGVFSEKEVVAGNGTSQVANTIISGLTPGVEYAFRMRAYNASGYSRYTDTIVSAVASPDLARLMSTPVISSPYCSSWADIDNDGDLDLIYGGYNGSSTDRIIILQNTGGSFSVQSHSLPQLTPYDLDWADYDQDGDLDLLLSGTPASGNAQTKLMINEGNFVFSEYTASAIRGIRSGFARWADANGDGYQDIFLSGTVDGDNTVHVSQLLINQKDGTFNEKFDSGLPALYQSDVEIGDYNRDGKVDFVIGGFKDTLNNLTRATELYINQGNNEFKLHQAFQESSDARVESGDFDMDGDSDIIISGNYSATRLYWNNNGNFVSDTRNNLFAFLYGGVAVGDIDNDGDPDIILGGSGSTFKARTYINDGTGLFAEGYYAISRTSGNQYALGDIDADGDLDLFEAGSAFITPAILKNDVSTVNGKPAAPTIIKADAIAGGILLKWERGPDDKTTSKSLTSNVYVEDANGKILFNSHADVTTGVLKKPVQGNVFLNDSVILRGLEPGTYTVGVQNIDNSFVASSFATAVVTVELVAPTLITRDPGACENSTVDLEVLGNSVVWYQDEELTISIGDGNVLRALLKESDSVFYAVQKSGDQRSPALPVTVRVFRNVKGTITHEGDSLTAPEAESYQWFTNGTVMSGMTSRKIHAAEPGEYSVAATNGTCSPTVLYFTLRPSVPEISFAATLCENDSQNLAAVGSNVVWYDKDGEVMGTGNTLTRSGVALADTIVYVTQTVNSIESEKLKVVWQVLAYPAASVTLQNGMLVASPGMTYQWYYNDQEIAGAVNRELMAGEDDGLYYAIVANGSCKTTSEGFLYTSVEENPNQLRIFQQLPDGAVIVESHGDVIHDITVYDSSGKRVLYLKNPEVRDGVYIMDVQSLQRGLFIAHVNAANPYRGKFLKGE